MQSVVHGSTCLLVRGHSKFARPEARRCRICVRAAKGSSKGSSSSPQQQASTPGGPPSAPPSWAQNAGDETVVSQEWQPPPPGAYYNYQQQPQPYVSVPQYPIAPQPEAPKPPTGWNLPWYLWVGVGFLAANILAKVLNVAKTGPEQMQQMMMEQMMKQAMSQMGGQAPGQASPFGSPFGGGGGGGGSPPFGGSSNNPFAQSSGNPFGGSTASPFGGSSASSRTTSDFPPMPPAIDVTPRQPTSSTPPPPPFQQTTNPKSAFFTDAESSSPSSPSNGSSSSSSSSNTAAWESHAASFFKDAQDSSSAEGGAGDTAGGSELLSSIEFMLTDTRMQQMLFPHLPEEMRNPETVQAMLKDPVTRKKMEQSMAEVVKGFPPDMLKNMNNLMGGAPSLDNPDYRKQFEAAGTTPEQVMQKLMADPDLLRGIQNPRVMKAVMEVSSNPLAILNYKDDQEVYTVLMRMQQLLAPETSK